MEFEKYKQLGAYHWDAYKIEGAYRRSVIKILNWIDYGTILDIGAGDGLITHLFIEKGLHCIGIDDNEVAVALANEKGIDVRLGDAYDLSEFYGQDFNHALMADVIEHFEFPERALEEVKKILAPDGHLYISTPLAKPDGNLRDKYHYREYKQEELKDYMESLGFILSEPLQVQHGKIYGKFKVEEV